MLQPERIATQLQHGESEVKAAAEASTGSGFSKKQAEQFTEMKRELMTFIASEQHKLIDLVSYTFEAERQRSAQESKEERQQLARLVSSLADSPRVSSEPTTARAVRQPAKETPAGTNLVSSLFDAFRSQGAATETQASSQHSLLSHMSQPCPKQPTQRSALEA